MRVYSSLTRKMEDFQPLVDGELRMYACGITPYDEIHIGHARQAIVYDVLRAYFEFLGYKVIYVRNFTDVDDKIIKRANKEGRQSSEVSEQYIEDNSRDLELLKVRKATYEPKVTECIPDIIGYIQGLIDNGFAYVSNGEVLFDVGRFADYGKLSNRRKEELVNSEESPNKRSSNDFVLWKPHKPGEPHWDSPWSKGRPGWHIECSAMAMKFLGEEIDIHGGGLDLIFPHHENEIAQSEGYSGKRFARYWLHNGLVMVDGTKMSKSLGNFLTVKEALKSYFAEEIRYVVLTHNYSTNIDFSKSLFLNARKRLYYFYTTLSKINQILAGENADISPERVPAIIAGLGDSFVQFMDDNFNTPRVTSELADVFKELNRVLVSGKYSLEEKKGIFAAFLKSFRKVTNVLGLFEEDPDEYLSKLRARVLTERGLSEDMIKAKVAERQSAKEAQDYARADSIKEKLKAAGITVQDSRESAGWEIIFQ